MSERKNLVGMVFGDLTVIKKVPKPNTVNHCTKAYWLCQCTCGNNKIATTNELTSGKCFRCAECSKKASSSARRKDLTGQKFGHLTVQKMIYPQNGKKVTKCECLCDCGKTYIKGAYKLSHDSNEDTSCGCINRKRNSFIKNTAREITGQRFGKLVVLETLWDEIPPKVKCQCDCGNIVILNKNDVQSGHTKSCGCLQSENTSVANLKDWTNVKSDAGVIGISPAYKNSHGTWIWNFKCPICGEIFQALPAKVYENTIISCGCSLESKGESFIKHVLQDNIIANDATISYEQQYTFDDCKYIYSLRFDFAVFRNQSLVALIEYNGRQHYTPINFFGGEEGYTLTHKRDMIKLNYCSSNNIPLIVLPYTMTDNEIYNKIINTIYP